MTWDRIELTERLFLDPLKHITENWKWRQWEQQWIRRPSSVSALISNKPAIFTDDASMFALQRRQWPMNTMWYAKINIWVRNLARQRLLPPQPLKISPHVQTNLRKTNLRIYRISRQIGRRDTPTESHGMSSTDGFLFGFSSRCQHSGDTQSEPSP